MKIHCCWLVHSVESVHCLYSEFASVSICSNNGDHCGGGYFRWELVLHKWYEDSSQDSSSWSLLGWQRSQGLASLNDSQPPPLMSRRSSGSSHIYRVVDWKSRADRRRPLLGPSIGVGDLLKFSFYYVKDAKAILHSVVHYKSKQLGPLDENRELNTQNSLK